MARRSGGRRSPRSDAVGSPSVAAKKMTTATGARLSMSSASATPTRGSPPSRTIARAVRASPNVTTNAIATFHSLHGLGRLVPITRAGGRARPGCRSTDSARLAPAPPWRLTLVGLVLQ